jgi:hypothetical protein
MRFRRVVMVGLLASTLSACADEDACDKAVAAVADRREACGAARGPDEFAHDCEPQYSSEESCRLACYNAASCEAIRGEDVAGSMALLSCANGCGP